MTAMRINAATAKIGVMLKGSPPILVKTYDIAKLKIKAQTIAIITRTRTTSFMLTLVRSNYVKTHPLHDNKLHRKLKVKPQKSS